EQPPLPRPGDRHDRRRLLRRSRRREPDGVPEQPPRPVERERRPGRAVGPVPRQRRAHSPWPPAPARERPARERRRQALPRHGLAQLLRPRHARGLVAVGPHQVGRLPPRRPRLERRREHRLRHRALRDAAVDRQELDEQRRPQAQHPAPRLLGDRRRRRARRARRGRPRRDVHHHLRHPQV
ncbi:MAG: hypothetical protein AVDCRST_MAG85-3385, partial [uncultured Solirubrobacteraceae bacterium]